MANRPVFTPEQVEVLRATARRLFDTKYAHIKKSRGEEGDGPQDAFAADLHLSQQTVSALLKGTYSPGIVVAKAIASLDGKNLDILFREAGIIEADAAANDTAEAVGSFPNLGLCIDFHRSVKSWSPWTIAAAKAGIFGIEDPPAPKWPSKLDAIEKALKSVRDKKHTH